MTKQRSVERKRIIPDGTYSRTVTVRRPDGSVVCARSFFADVRGEEIVIAQNPEDLFEPLVMYDPENPAATPSRSCASLGDSRRSTLQEEEEQRNE